MQFGHNDPATVESLRQKNRRIRFEVSDIFVPFEYNYFPHAAQLISFGVFKRYAP